MDHRAKLTMQASGLKKQRKRPPIFAPTTTDTTGTCAASDIDIFYPICQMAMSVNYNCDQVQTYFENSPKLRCIIDNANCGLSKLQKNMKSNNLSSSTALLLGPFCEYHFGQYINGYGTNVYDTSEMFFEILNGKAILDNQPLPLFPLWSAQPINYSQNQYLELFHRNPNSPLDGIENFSALLAMGSRGYKPGHADLTENERKIMLKLMSFANSFSKILKHTLQCTRHNTINLYFTKQYMLDNANNGWLRHIEQYGLDEEYPGFENTELHRYAVPYTEFCTFDLLLIMVFKHSIHYPCIDNEAHTTHIPNIQIINGKYYYGTGFGLKQSLPLLSDENYSKSYPMEIMNVVKDRPVFHNFNVLCLDGTSFGNSTKMINLMSKNTTDPFTSIAQDTNNLYKTNGTLSI